MACPSFGSSGKVTVNGTRSQRTRQEWKENRPSEGPGGYYINVHDGYNQVKLDVCNSCNHIYESRVEHEQ